MSAAIDTQRRECVDTTQQELAPASDWCEAPSGSRQAWCVVASKPKAERRAHAALHHFGFTTYLPLVTVRWANRTWHTTALFPGYLFVQLDLAKPWSPVRNCPGVFNLVGINGVPSTCPPGAVEAILAGEEARQRPTTQESLYRPQQPCRAFLAGGEPVDAVIMAVRGDRAVVAAVMFGHLREINVSLDSLELRC